MQTEPGCSLRGIFMWWPHPNGIQSQQHCPPYSTRHLAIPVLWHRLRPGQCCLTNNFGSRLENPWTALSKILPLSIKRKTIHSLLLGQNSRLVKGSHKNLMLTVKNWLIGSRSSNHCILMFCGERQHT